jgi:hypothetical protein
MKREEFCFIPAVFSTAFFVLLIVTLIPAYCQDKPLNVAIIAPSASTAVKAGELIALDHLNEVDASAAEAYLVVTRSDLTYPLSSFYSDERGLRGAVESQFNSSGSFYHMYLYAVNRDASLTEIRHTVFSAEE